MPDAYYYQGIEVEAPDIEGEPIEFVIKESIKLQAKAIDKTISRLITTKGIPPQDIAIIVMGNYSEAESLLKSSTHKDLWAFKEYSPVNKVLVETAKRFKGLEANIIFLWITDSESMDEKLLYVSISRARFRLWIIGDEYIKRIQDLV